MSTEEAKRRVLEVSRNEAVPLTVAQLARRTRLNYAQTYLAVVELRREGKLDQVQNAVSS